MIAIFSLFIVCFFVIHVHSATINNEVVRVIDATSSIVRVVSDIKVSGIEKKEYHIIIPDNQVEKLAYVSARVKGSKSETLPLTAPVSNGNYTLYAVQFEKSIQTVNLIVELVFTGALEPYPKEITQLDNQMVVLSDSHLFYSPYVTESQKTIVKLASGTVESFTKRMPVNHKGATITFGPYKDTSSYQISPMKVHYVNNKPFAKFSSMVREVEVSHWGSVSFEDIYELKHAGAVLKGGFSRYEYQMKRQATNQNNPSFRNLLGILPVEARDIYYRDQIGNISTSDMLVNNGELELDIQTRFPIFGGWQTQFYIGWSLPTENVLFLDSNGRYNLKFDFYTIFEDVWVDELETKVILPEGATDIQVTAPYATEQQSSRRFTYLDSESSGGRPVIILKGRNLVEEHGEPVIISYSFDQKRMLVEPIMLISTFFVFFIICSIVSRIDPKVVIVGKKQA